MNCFIIILDDYECTCSDVSLYHHHAAALKVISKIAITDETTTTNSHRCYLWVVKIKIFFKNWSSRKMFRIRIDQCEYGNNKWKAILSAFRNNTAMYLKFFVTRLTYTFIGSCKRTYPPKLFQKIIWKNIGIFGKNISCPNTHPVKMSASIIFLVRCRWRKVTSDPLACYISG